MNSQASPAIATHVTGPNRYALLTKMAPMGAAERRAPSLPAWRAAGLLFQSCSSGRCPSSRVVTLT